jgi:hypothetical protein
MPKEYIPKIYLFRSGKLDKITREKVRNLTLNQKDIIVLFNKPIDPSIKYLLTEKYNKPVNYRFLRTGPIIRNNNIIHQHDIFTDINCKYYIESGNIANINNIIINNKLNKKNTYIFNHGITRIDNTLIGGRYGSSNKECTWCQHLLEPFIYWPTMGFHGFLQMITDFPNSNIYLVGFSFPRTRAPKQGGIGKGHNQVAEREYILKYYGDRTEIIL